RTDRYRYTEWGQDGAGGAELYDRTKDPGEMVNLAGTIAVKATQAELSKMLRQRVALALEKPKGLMQVRFSNRRRVR
ncbi:MAG: iduronate-2-sulfatase, partial [Planctomycetaceae bacterium]|nr:iduronate-2-sulfatase [Planctomycetaceae bacterium]